MISSILRYLLFQILNDDFSHVPYISSLLWFMDPKGVRCLLYFSDAINYPSLVTQDSRGKTHLNDPLIQDL